MKNTKRIFARGKSIDKSPTRFSDLVPEILVNKDINRLSNCINLLIGCINQLIHSINRLITVLNLWVNDPNRSMNYINLLINGLLALIG